MANIEMTLEDADLDRRWRARFGQPLPILGCSEIVRRILDEGPDATASAV